MGNSRKLANPILLINICQYFALTGLIYQIKKMEEAMRLGSMKVWGLIVALSTSLMLLLPVVAGAQNSESSQQPSAQEKKEGPPTGTK